PRQLRGGDAAAQRAVLAGADLRALRRPALVAAARAAAGRAGLARRGAAAVLQHRHAAERSALAVRPRHRAHRPRTDPPDGRFPPAAASPGGTEPAVQRDLMATGAPRAGWQSAPA